MEYEMDLPRWDTKESQINGKYPHCTTTLYNRSYVNVPDLAINDYGQEYYGKNFNRLRKVKAKYDPDNVFNFVQSIPPASSCKW